MGDLMRIWAMIVVYPPPYRCDALVLLGLRIDNSAASSLSDIKVEQSSLLPRGTV